MRGLFIIIFIALLWHSLLSGAHTVRQVVDDWPTTHDTTGVSWIVYAVSDPAQYNSTNDPVNTYIVYPFVGSPRIRWYTDIDNWDWVWGGGDEMISFGSWDSAYAANPGTYVDNPNHTGFYWVYNDTVDRNQAPQDWSSSPSQMWDTLRAMPFPIASLNGANDSVIVKVPHPVETNGNPEALDIMGFWLFADTVAPSPLGTPASLDMEVGYFGRGGGDTTYCRMPLAVFPSGRALLFAYRMVARPETSVVDTPPGYVSQYFSPNSNVVSPTGITETGLAAEILPQGIRLSWYCTGYLMCQFAEVIRDERSMARVSGFSFLDTAVEPGCTYRYRVNLHLSNGEVRELGPLSVAFQANFRFDLSISPNPFSGKGTIKLSIPAKQHVSVTVFDIAGRKQATLHSGTLTAGMHEFVFAPQNPKPGVYHIVIKNGNRKIAVRKVLLIR